MIRYSILRTSGFRAEFDGDVGERPLRFAGKYRSRHLRNGILVGALFLRRWHVVLADRGTVSGSAVQGVIHDA